jgi:hypothetical protein
MYKYRHRNLKDRMNLIFVRSIKMKVCTKIGYFRLPFGRILKKTLTSFDPVTVEAIPCWSEMATAIVCAKTYNKNVENVTNLFHSSDHYLGRVFL